MLTLAEQQVACRIESEVKVGQHLLLRLAVDVDEKIAAGNQVDADEGRIFQ